MHANFFQSYSFTHSRVSTDVDSRHAQRRRTASACSNWINLYKLSWPWLAFSFSQQCQLSTSLFVLTGWRKTDQVVGSQVVELIQLCCMYCKCCTTSRSSDSVSNAWSSSATTLAGKNGNAIVLRQTQNLNVPVRCVHALQTSCLDVPSDCLPEVESTATLQNSWKDLPDGRLHSCFTVHSQPQQLACVADVEAWRREHATRAYSLSVAVRHNAENQWNLLQLRVLLHKRMDGKELNEWLHHNFERGVDVHKSQDTACWFLCTVLQHTTYLDVMTFCLRSSGLNTPIRCAMALNVLIHTLLKCYRIYT